MNNHTCWAGPIVEDHCGGCGRLLGADPAEEVIGDGSGEALPPFNTTTAGWSPPWRPVPVVCDVLQDFPHFLNHGDVPCRNPRQVP